MELNCLGAVFYEINPIRDLLNTRMIYNPFGLRTHNSFSHSYFVKCLRFKLKTLVIILLLELY